MLQNMHDKTQTWITKVIIGLICVAFAVWGLESLIIPGNSSDKKIAKVNGEVITQRQYHDVLQSIQQRRIQQHLPIDEAKLKKYAMKSLINQAVLTSYAKAHHLVVSDATVDGFITNMPMFQTNGNFDKKKFLSLLGNNGITPRGYKESQRQEILLDQTQTAIASSAFITPFQAANYAKLEQQKRNMAWAVLELSQAQKKQKVDSSSIDSYYKAHHNSFMSPQQVRVDYIMLTQKSLAKNIKVTDTDLQSAYKVYLAKHTSDTSKPDKGGSKPNKPKSLKEVRAQLTTQIQNSRASQVFQSESQRLADKVFQSSNLQEPAKALNLDVKTTPFFDRNGGKSIAANKGFVQVAFSDNVMVDGNNSDLIQISPTEVAFLHIRDIKQPHQQTIEDVSPAIEKILKKEEAVKTLDKRASDVIFALKHEKTKNHISSSFDIVWKEAAGVSRQQKNVPPLVLKKAFELVKPAKKESFGRVKLPSGNIAIVIVSKVIPGSASFKKDRKDIVLQSLRGKQGLMDYENLTQGLQKQASIEVLNKPSDEI